MERGFLPGGRSAGVAGRAWKMALLANENPALREQLVAFRAAQTEAARNMTLPTE